MQLNNLIHGTTFLLLSDQNKYVLTHDFNNRNERLCVNVSTGSLHWINESSEVQVVPIYVLDGSNNIIPIKEDGNYELDQNTNIS